MQIVKLSLAEQARNALLEEIVSGNLTAGMRLTEESLSAQLGISRTPVRDALSRLEGDGLIERLSSRGYQVKKLDVDAVDELLQCRCEVEMNIFNCSYDALSRESLLELKQELCSLEPADPEAWIEARKLDDALHNIINDACSNRYWRDIHRKLLQQRLPYRDIRNSSDPALVEALKKERLTLLEELLSGDRKRAAQALFRHLEAGRKYILKTMQKQPAKL